MDGRLVSWQLFRARACVYIGNDSYDCVVSARHKLFCNGAPKTQTDSKLDWYFFYIYIKCTATSCRYLYTTSVCLGTRHRVRVLFSQDLVQKEGSDLNTHSLTPSVGVDSKNISSEVIGEVACCENKLSYVCVCHEKRNMVPILSSVKSLSFASCSFYSKHDVIYPPKNGTDNWALFQFLYQPKTVSH